MVRPAALTHGAGRAVKWVLDVWRFVTDATDAREPVESPARRARGRVRGSSAVQAGDPLPRGLKGTQAVESDCVGCGARNEERCLL